MSESGREQEGAPIQELTPSKEIPQHVATVKIPPVGRIRAKEVRFSLHNSPLKAIVEFLDTVQDVPDLSIEGRILDENQIAALKKDPRFAFLSLSRLRFKKEADDTLSPYMMFPRQDVAGNPVTDLQAAANLSESLTPGEFSSDVGYDVGFVPLEQVRSIKSTVGGAINHLLLGCSEFRVGSNALSQSELDALANKMGEHVFQDEINRAKIDPYEGNIPHNETYRFLQVRPSYIPK